MFTIIGIVVVLAAVIVGYVMHHGNLAVLIQPNEFVILFGAGFAPSWQATEWRVSKAPSAAH